MTLAWAAGILVIARRRDALVPRTPMMPNASIPHVFGNISSGLCFRSNRRNASAANPTAWPIAKTSKVGAGAAKRANDGHVAQKKIDSDPIRVAVFLGMPPDAWRAFP